MFLKHLLPKTARRAVRRFFAALRYNVAVAPRRHLLPAILSLEETINAILRDNLSVCRYGDGELNIIRGVGNGFCAPDARLGERLRDILQDSSALEKKILVCIPGSLADLTRDVPESRYFWHLHFLKTFDSWLRYATAPSYGNSLATRYYINYLDPDYAAHVVALWKKVWDKRDVLVVEGAESRIGVGNDLFDNVRSLRRVLCPGKDAFRKYDSILEAARKHGRECLVLIALGQTAAVLAYDLALEGIQALDLGHIDVEYEWFRMGATEKVDIPSKAVNEVRSLGATPATDPVYLSQIVERIEAE